jgi:hypothetical protein
MGNILNSNDLLYMIQEPLGDASGEFMIKNDDGDYHDHDNNSIQVQSTVFCTMKSELRERSSNTNTYVMVI